LDLLNFPSLFFYQTGYRLNIVRQASRRHWRIGQPNKCLTMYAAYKNSMQELAINLMAAKMSAAMALEGQFSQEGLAALTEGSGGSLATELAKRFVGNNIEGVESAESIWGKMTIDASQILPASSIEAPSYEEEEVDEPAVWDLLSSGSPQDAGQAPLDTRPADEPEVFDSAPVVPVEPGTIYTGESIRAALLEWAADVIPADLYPRFEQQMEYVEQNVIRVVDGLRIKTSGAEVTLAWDATKAPSESADFRRWVFGLTNKPIVERTEATKEEFQLKLVVEGKKPTVKTKKSYNVGEGQYAFNF
jgi:hypothetical protein